jgi:hypothetical protein
MSRLLLNGGAVLFVGESQKASKTAWKNATAYA